MKKRIVIIDDSPMVLKLTKKTLEASGYEVLAFEDPGEFEARAGAAPDLMLIDINMPQFFGDDVVSYFKEVGVIGAPIFLFSNVAEEELASRAQACGAEGYISKDWGLDELVNRVRSVIGE